MSIDKDLVTLSVLVENKFGVLARVAALFARRGYNIYSLAVAPTEDGAFSRMDITFDSENTNKEQVVLQLDKLIHVISIKEIPVTIAAVSDHSISIKEHA